MPGEEKATAAAPTNANDAAAEKKPDATSKWSLLLTEPELVKPNLIEPRLTELELTKPAFRPRLLPNWFCCITDFLQYIL